jgi:hypothetical protein
MAMDEMDSKSLVDIVFDKNLCKDLQMRGRYLRSQLLAVNECIIPRFGLATVKPFWSYTEARLTRQSSFGDQKELVGSGSPEFGLKV